MLKIKPSSTFKAPVTITIPGGGEEKVVFEFKHLTKKELDEFIKVGREMKREDVQTLMAIAVGWEGTDAAFNEENINQCIENYHQFAVNVVETYLRELTQIKEKN